MQVLPSRLTSAIFIWLGTPVASRCSASALSRCISFSRGGVVAGERDRPDVARRRAQWTKYQNKIEPERLVFVDETWTKTNMAPLRGWGPRGRRIKAKVPYGHWNTTSLGCAASRSDRGAVAS